MGKVLGGFCCFDGFPDDAEPIDQEVGYEFCPLVVLCLVFSPVLILSRLHL
jgi:hypothetical protein